MEMRGCKFNDGCLKGDKVVKTGGWISCLALHEVVYLFELKKLLNLHKFFFNIFNQFISRFLIIIVWRTFENH